MMFSRSRQVGVTLVELMVGLTISMIVILAMLGVFKVSVKASANAGMGATTDRQRLAGLYAAQKIMTGAGYGIATPTFGADLVILRGATLSGGRLSGTQESSLPATGTAIIWGEKLNGHNYTCQGLYAKTTGGLTRLAEAACDNVANNYGSITWDTIELIDDSRTALIFANRAAGCQAFGIAGSGGVSVTLTTTNSIEGANAPVSTTTCLLNFPSS